MSDNEQDFEALRRLLALKRHEVPPPGFFGDFSSYVVARIRAREAAARMPWFLKLLQAFESRPAYPVGLASSLCMLLLFGIVTVEQNPSISPAFAADSSGFPVATVTMGAQMDGSQSLLAMATNPPVDLPANSSLFSSQPNP
ncbi:MAG TPA: hypothetical protein VNU95_07180 [Candidatus Acidoferrales bacterium]|jgi:hypothetical protein|nr:hypothetical protein [Candidatus Acidoferrales bacterium]